MSPSGQPSERNQCSTARFQRQLLVPGSCAFRGVLRLHRGSSILPVSVMPFYLSSPWSSDNGLERALSEPGKIPDGFEELNEVSKPAARWRHD
jgi:hypothetical protein